MEISKINKMTLSRQLWYLSTPATKRQRQPLLRRLRSRTERQLQLLLRWRRKRRGTRRRWRRRRWDVGRAKARVVQSIKISTEGARSHAGRHQPQDFTASAISLQARPHRVRPAAAAGGVNAKNDPVAHLGRIVSGDIGRPQ